MERGECDAALRCSLFSEVIGDAGAIFSLKAGSAGMLQDTGSAAGSGRIRILSPAGEIRRFSARLAFVLWRFRGDVFFVPIKGERARGGFDGLKFRNVVGYRRTQLGKLAR
jgi:hypothetical protein